MAAAVENSPGANGTIQQDTGEMTEYKKILNIRDQIFSGSHPRLKVPPHVIRKISPRSAHTPSSSAPHAPASQEGQGVEPVVDAEEGVNDASLYTAEAEEAEPSALAAADFGSTHAPAPVSASKPASEIDPIFLTKSDDLIRAEIQLQRQRIERGIRDQYEQQKLGATQRPLQQESKPDFNVADVLAKAFELVKPITISDREAANPNVAASDSFDENSFYSSKAPDSPPHAEQSPASPASDKQTRPMEVEIPDADIRVDRRVSDAREYDPADYNPANVDTQPPRYGLTRRSHENVAMRDVSPGPAGIADHPATYDEPEYSPPGPKGPSTRERGPQDYSPQASRSMRKRPSYRASGNGQDFQRDIPAPAPHAPRVVNNHITSPAAPQPSKVSPLAVSRVSSMQGRQGDQARQGEKVSGGQASGRSSPEGPSQPLMSRKRRRVQETREKPRYTTQRRAAESPEIPYIKPEPESPPPLADVPVSSSYPRARGARRAAPIEMDLEEPTRYAPVTERRERDRVAAPAYDDDRYGKNYDMESSAADVAVPRSPSGMAYRRPLREARDLRRVASLQNARQAEYVQDYGEAEFEPRYTRASSYAVANERPAATERSQYYEEPPPAQPSYGRRYVTGPVSPPSPRFREDYAEAPRAMAPPQRRVVVDADGNRYYESVPAAPKVAAHPPSSRYTRAEEYEDGPSMRSGSVRAVSVMEHPYGERRYRQEMPPPPPPPAGYRRAAPEYSRSVAPEPLVYSSDAEPRRAAAPALRSGSVQVVDYPTRRGGPSYIEDEAHYPREEVARVPSARPPPSRYEEAPQPREAVHRMQSVRPAGREMSVYVDDPAARPRQEYLPMERMGYGPATATTAAAAARPVEEGYYDDEEPPPKMAVERGGPEMVRRVSRRY